MVRRKVNAAAFKRQVSEAVVGDGSLVEVEVNAQASVWVKLPVHLDADDDYARRLSSATDERAMCMEALGHREGVTAEEQWATWAEGFGDGPDSTKLLVAILGAETAAAEERAKNFRYRG